MVPLRVPRALEGREVMTKGFVQNASFRQTRFLQPLTTQRVPRCRRRVSSCRGLRAGQTPCPACQRRGCTVLLHTDQSFRLCPSHRISEHANESERFKLPFFAWSAWRALPTRLGACRGLTDVRGEREASPAAPACMPTLRPADAAGCVPRTGRCARRAVASRDSPADMPTFQAATASRGCALRWACRVAPAERHGVATAMTASPGLERTSDGEPRCARVAAEAGLAPDRSCHLQIWVLAHCPRTPGFWLCLQAMLLLMSSRSLHFPLVCSLQALLCKLLHVLVCFCAVFCAERHCPCAGSRAASSLQELE